MPKRVPRAYSATQESTARPPLPLAQTAKEASTAEWHLQAALTAMQPRDLSTRMRDRASALFAEPVNTQMLPATHVSLAITASFPSELQAPVPHVHQENSQLRVLPVVKPAHRGRSLLQQPVKSAQRGALQSLRLMCAHLAPEESFLRGGLLSAPPSRPGIEPTRERQRRARYSARLTPSPRAPTTPARAAAAASATPGRPSASSALLGSTSRAAAAWCHVLSALPGSFRKAVPTLRRVVRSARGGSFRRAELRTARPSRLATGPTRERPRQARKSARPTPSPRAPTTPARAVVTVTQLPEPHPAPLARLENTTTRTTLSKIRPSATLALRGNIPPTEPSPRNFVSLATNEDSIPGKERASAQQQGPARGPMTTARE